MALAESPIPVFQRGDWPGPLTLRRGWARAEARPWNDVVPDAILRIVRGGTAFVQACTDVVKERGAPTVFSPPLAASARRSWEHAGYQTFIELALMRQSLEDPIPSPDHLVVEVDGADPAGLLAIDRAAFADFWRFDRRGMEEAMNATSRSSVFVVRNAEGRPAAYAIVGYGHAICYLQRVAVDPLWQGRGMGRSLVRVAARAARASGARAMLLNTQPENEPAMALYRSEGYVTLTEPLAVLRFG
jgi:ribosomal protein S18 acetylase RimI-like enzyme